jgi:hypothetical protein
MKKLLLLATITATLFASVSPLHVELNLYTNKTLVNKTYALNSDGELTVKVPQNTAIENIKYSIEDGCEIQNSMIEKTQNENTDQRKQEITNQINALKAKENLLKTISLKDTKLNDEIDNISNLLVEKLTLNMSEIDRLNKELKELNKATKALDKNLKISFTCKKDNKHLTITYPSNSMKYTPFYDISANINNKSVLIEKKATLFYKGNEEYKDVDLNIYSYNYNQNIAPQNFYPRYLGEEKIAFAKTMMAMDSVQRSAPKAEIEHKELATKSLYKIKGISLKPNEKNLLEIDKDLLDASFKTIIDAYGSNRAYLEATIKTEKDYSRAKVNYFLNKNPISSTYMKKIRKDKDTKLYFGEDEHIQVEKELIKTLDEKTFFGENKISTQNWKYTITNTKPYSVDIEFIERVPVSKDGDIKVKTLAQPKFDSQNAKGKTTWNFKLNANERKNIIFGYEVSNSK